MFTRLRAARPTRLDVVNAIGFVGVLIAAVLIVGDDAASRVLVAAAVLGMAGLGTLFLRRRTDRLARNLFVVAAGVLVLGTAFGAVSNEIGQGSVDPGQRILLSIIGTALAIGFVGATVVVLRGLGGRPDAAAEDGTPPQAVDE